MKFLTFLISLLAFSACKVSESSKSKSCKLNRDAVDCRRLESNQANSPSENGSISLTAKVSTPIRIEGNYIEVLSRANNTKKETFDGRTYECAAETFAGDVFYYSFSGKNLVLEMEGQQLIFKRIGNGDKVIGIWLTIQNDDLGATHVTFKFTKNSLEITSTCHFNKNS